MSSDEIPSGIDRRALVAGLALLPTASGALLSTVANAQVTPGVPLPSWNDGPAKQGIIDFVRATTEQGNPKFVVLEERIATFDTAGTLWVEHPLYSQGVYCL